LIGENQSGGELRQILPGISVSWDAASIQLGKGAYGKGIAEPAVGPGMCGLKNSLKGLRVDEQRGYGLKEMHRYLK